MSRREVELPEDVFDEQEELTGCQEIPEWVPHPDLDPMLADWIRIAALAWQGYILQGAGALVVRVCSCGVHYEFRSMAVPECASECVRSYDPKGQVVVVVQRGEDQRPYVVAGWPSPPQAFAILPAEAIDATVH
jgi:hypothetical protein